MYIRQERSPGPSKPLPTDGDLKKIIINMGTPKDSGTSMGKAPSELVLGPIEDVRILRRAGKQSDVLISHFY